MTDLASVLSLAPRRVLAEEAADRLREAILHGHFAPGEHLRENALATVLGVSRGIVREALTALGNEGLVLIQRHRGATVARLSQNDIEEVYSLRVALERLAVQQAACKASPEDIFAMEAVLKEMMEAFARGVSAQEVANLDVRFHDLVFRAAHHQRLFDCWSNLRSQTYMFLLMRNSANSDFRELTVTMHAAVVDALRNRDEETALRVIDEHLTGSYTRISELYKNMGPDAQSTPKQLESIRSA